MKKFCGLALTLALLMLLFPGTAFADSAGETTYTFRETFDNTAFPKAAKFRYTMPEGVVVNVPADKIFVMTGDKPLRAACGDGRALCMIKEYVNIDVEIIYYFEHGIRSIEYMASAVPETGGRLQQRGNIQHLHIGSPRWGIHILR